MDNSQSIVRALKRIQNDLKELSNSPLPGVGVCRASPTEDFKFIVNIKLLYGVYEGIVLHLLMEVPHTYPINPPKMLIYGGQPFGHDYHHHVYDGPDGFYKFCIDLLDNTFMDTKEKGTGWSPAYTFKTIFMQMQHFLSDPDMKAPSEEMISLLKENMKKFQHEIPLEDGSTAVHCMELPYPPLFEGIEKVVEEGQKDLQQKIAQSLTCFLTKSDFITDKSIILGYPLLVNFDFKDRIEPCPIPELLSYEGYIQEIQNNPEKLDNYKNLKFKTSMGEFYNYWFPIYINEDHFQRSKELILNSISVLKYGIEGKKEFDFKPELIIEVLPALLNKMIFMLFKQSSKLSLASIEAYCQYLLLFDRLLQEYPELKDTINQKIKNFHKGDFALNKKEIPDIGNFFILLFMSDFPYDDKNTLRIIINEVLARQIFWIFLNPADKKQVKVEILKILMNDRNLKQYFQNPAQVIEDKIKVLNSELIWKFSKNFLQYFPKLKPQDPKFSHNFFKYPPIFEEDEDAELAIWKKCENLFGEICGLQKILKFAHQFDTSILLSRYYHDDRILLFEKCTETTKQELIKYTFNKSKVAHYCKLFSYSVARKFINKEYLDTLKKNFGIIEEAEAAKFLETLNTLKLKVDSYSKLMDAIGFPEYFNKDNKEFDRLLKSIALSNKQKYSVILATRATYLKYGLTNEEVDVIFDNLKTLGWDNDPKVYFKKKEEFKKKDKPLTMRNPEAKSIAERIQKVVDVKV